MTLRIGSGGEELQPQPDSGEWTARRVKNLRKAIDAASDAMPRGVAKRFIENLSEDHPEEVIRFLQNNSGRRKTKRDEFFFEEGPQTEALKKATQSEKRWDTVILATSAAAMFGGAGYIGYRVKKAGESRYLPIPRDELPPEQQKERDRQDLYEKIALWCAGLGAPVARLQATKGIVRLLTDNGKFANDIEIFANALMQNLQRNGATR